MSFLEISFSELLVDLSEEQQEFVAGGATYETHHTYQEYIEEHSSETEPPSENSGDPFQENFLGDPFFSPNRNPFIRMPSLPSFPSIH